MTVLAGAQRAFGAVIRAQGSQARGYERGTAARNADGSDATSWQPVAALADLSILLFPVTVAAAQRRWGVQTEARYRGFVVDTHPVALRQGLTVTARHHAGKRFLVVEAPQHAGAGVLEVGLMETTEVFS